jgi:hypothetical protein
MNVISLPSQFFNDRGGSDIRYIVLHTTEGTDSRTWLTETGNVSANYLIQRSTVYQLVPEEYAAWHAGRIVGTPTTPLYDGVNPNLESIGIEMEGFADQLLESDTLNAAADLIRDIRARRGPLPLVNHGELSPGDRHDPGTRNRAAIDALLAGGEDMTVDQLLAMLNDPAVVEKINTFTAIKQVLADEAAAIRNVSASGSHIGDAELAVIITDIGVGLQKIGERTIDAPKP